MHAQGVIGEIGLGSSDRWLHVSPMFHLADAWAVWAVTRAGGVHVFVPDFEPEAVLSAIETHKVTLSNFIPTMLNILVNYPEVNKYDTSSLRLIMSGGAPIAREVVRKVIDIFGCQYIQTYGLTETSPFLTMSILREDMKELPFEERLDYMVTTGRPFHNVKLKVVKEDGSEVEPDGKDAGEILVKGDTITPGYWHLPDQTSTRIVDGWLHTRDLAVVDSEGYVTIVDRMDDLIITGGENVYSIEVENVLYSHPGVLEAAVIGLPDPVWGEMVTGVVVPKEGREPTEEELIEFCKKNLASFKAPKKVFLTEELPKTGSAKVYKYRLREMYRTKG
ncbi:MAG: AMP-binding protein [Thermoplasmata archaeon]|nr:MAG: AMP-binding protein [Thermoplasmata archaeon]